MCESVLVCMRVKWLKVSNGKEFWMLHYMTIWCPSPPGKPHNPMINAGALMLSSLIKPSLSITERVNFVSTLCKL